MKHLILLSLLFLISCTTPQTPKTAPNGRSADQHGKMMFYKAPEEIWPDDFKPAPQVCGSPFTGKLIAR